MSNTVEQISEAKKFDNEKPRFDLLPPDALNCIAQVLTFGAQKYDARNWEKGMDWGRLFAAAQRHLWAFQNNENEDQETGLPHLAHAACCCMMLLSYQLRKTGKDDRYVNESARDKLLKELMQGKE